MDDERIKAKITEIVDSERLSKIPFQYAIYKKKGAMQFQLMNPYSKRNDSGYYKEGTVFLEAAPSQGERKYDWENKIVFSLGVNDLSKIALALRNSTQLSIIHDPNAQTDRAGSITKVFKVEPAQNKGTFYLNLRSTKGSEIKEASTSIDGNEAFALFNLFSSSISRILGW